MDNSETQATMGTRHRINKTETTRTPPTNWGWTQILTE